MTAADGAAASTGAASPGTASSAASAGTASSGAVSSGAQLTERLTGFVRTLRGHGIRIGPGETVDAAAVLEVLGLADRERIREGLAAALLRADRQRAVFDAAFELYFPLGVGELTGAWEAPAADRDELRARIAAALAAGDVAALNRLAGEAVELLGRYGTSSESDGWSAHQTLDRLRPQTLLAGILAAQRAGGGSGGGGGSGFGPGNGAGTGAAGAGSGGSGSGGFTDRLDADEIRRRIEDFRERVRTEARRRVAERRGAALIAQRGIARSADQVDFLVANREQLAELRRTVQPLARRLATRLAARRRRAARGRIDIRRTLRRSLSTGGVPLRPAYRRHRPARPEIVLLCDVSGSVAGFANFTMLLVQAMRDQFSKVRVFAFVNKVDEVTHLVTTGEADPAELGRRIAEEATISGWHGSSDYGTALGEFAEHHLDAVGPRASVIVLGDARTNGFDPNAAALRRVAARARRVHWLNPESPELWSTGDSAALVYAEVVEMHSCRNARRLAELVTRLLPV
ncbi:VWA domain-containing protein [Streptomyces heilongjiangensis]|uniref:VWA domain-containing protein n=1 Tax=Streptomyces heilongjiangensis TaxID=945052 RepID=A0ABW1BF45_9ACTN|nr:VWA domain-containing protein [Streptomyces heilongjiangensis]MDC2949733.1 VWA domain-containing protein [Streptomyces heilongjiangensis]